MVILSKKLIDISKYREHFHSKLTQVNEIIRKIFGF